MKLRIALLSLLLLASTLLGLRSASAQSSTGTLEGTVLDGNQRPVFNALVTVVQADTQRTLTTRTTRAGVFSFPGLDAGSYNVTIAAKSFNTEQAVGINIDAGGSATKDFTLKPGSENLSVTVYGEALNLEKDSSSVDSNISQELLTSIPLPDHASLGLVTLIPGVSGDPQFSNGVQSELPGIFTNPTIPGASLSLGGSRPGLASQLIDGFDVTQSGYPRAGISFTPFAIRGISVQMAAMSAEFGRTGGGVINQASQAGGTQYHGTIEYRHTDPFFGQAYRTGSNVRSDIHQTLYGGVISGPVGIPGWKKVKNTFFLFTYEPLRQRSVQFSRARLLTPDELAGRLWNPNDNFLSYGLLNSSVLSSQGYAAAYAASFSKTNDSLLDPVYYEYAHNAQGFPIGTKLTTGYNIIPNADLSAQVLQNPVALFVQAHYPTPANPGNYVTFDNAIGSYDTSGNNAYAARGVVNHDDRYSVRIDHTFPNNDHLFARYSIVPVSGVRYGFLGPSNPLNNIATDETTSRNFAVNYVHLFGSRIVNESRVSYIRGFRYRIPPPSALTQDYGAALGLVPATNGVGMPALSFSDGSTAVGGGGAFQDGGRSLDEGYGFGNETTIISGRHQIKFGGEFRALQLNRTDVSNDFGGTYLFSSQDTGGPSNGGTTTGSAIASFDLGLINQFTTAGSQPFYYRWKYIAGFVQDTWKARSNLTVNYGLRYNLEYPRSEKNNLQGSFLPNVTGTLGGVPVTGGLVRSGTYGLGTTIFPVNYKGFEPRIGISFAPKPWVVVKTGYALIHAPLTGVGNTIEPGFQPAAEQIVQGGGGVAPGVLDFITNQPAPIARIGAVTNQNPLFSYTNSLLPEIDQTNAVPYVEIWNLGAQFMLGKQTVVEVNYVGQRAIHLYSPVQTVNLPDQAALYALQQQHYAFSSTCRTNPYAAAVPGNETNLQCQQPYQQFWNNPISQAYNRHSFSFYDGLYLSARRQATRNLTLIGGFTWQKSLDNNSTPTPDGTAIDAFGLTYPQSPYTPTGDYSVSSFDQPVRVTLGYNFTFPFGKGQYFLPSHRILDYFIGGFTTSGFFSAQSGYPISVGEGNNGWFLSQAAYNPAAPNATMIPGAFGATQLGNHLRPNIIPGVPLINPCWKGNKLGLAPLSGACLQTGNGYLNKLAFAAPGSENNPQYGNAPRELSAARNPRSINWDASVRKNINLPKHLRMSLWTDIQNVANHPNFFITTAPANVFSGSLLTTFTAATPNPGYGPNGPFQYVTGFSVPNAYSATRVINVGASLSF